MQKRFLIGDGEIIVQNLVKAIKENKLKLDIKAPMKDVPSMTRAIELYIKQANKV